MNLLNLDGLIVDEDTGEIIDVPEGQNALDMVAHRLADAKDQAKEWAHIVQIYSAVVLREQADKKAIYGDTVLNQVYGSAESFDRSEWMLDSLGLELIRDEWRALAQAATGFDRDALKAADKLLGRRRGLSPLIQRYYKRKDRAPYVTVSKVRRAAPRVVRTVAEEDSEDE